MHGRLQSSYEDVEAELSMIFNELGGRAIFAAGDGLSIMRMNHLLSNKPDVYIDMSPHCIPLQGCVPCALPHLPTRH
jgi:hypothetical protein